MILVRLADMIVLSWGWKRRLIAVLAGALAALSMAPVGAFPVLFLSFPVLILLIDGARAARSRGARLRAAFGAGWWFGFGYFLCSLWWIGSAFLVEASTFGWLLPVAVAGLPAGLAFFTGAGTALAYALWARGPYRVLSFALGLMAAEYARSVLFTGFPWNLFGEALTQWLWLAQSASLVGVMGLTFVALVVFASPVALCEAHARGLTRVGPVMAALSLLLVMALFGAWRVETTPIKQVEGPRLRLIQPDIPQDERFRPASKDWIMERYETLSKKATSQDRKSLADVTHLFWPESSFPFFLIYDPEALGRIARMLPAGTTLITGAVRPEISKSGGTRPDVYNSAYALNNKGEILATTDKFHLVPFGEYLPFQAALEAMGLQQITRMRGGFSAAAGPQLTRLSGLPPFVTLICYEIIFPRVIASLDSRPAWILNLTNDAWFGTTPGPYQHAHKAVIRAIEEGLPVVRVANNGISMVVGPTGRVEASLPLNARNALDFVLDQPLAATIYARFGDILLFLVALLSLKVVWSRKLHPFD
jgi:apolipoprotein N-acyltransferase